MVGAGLVGAGDAVSGMAGGAVGCRDTGVDARACPADLDDPLRIKLVANSTTRMARTSPKAEKVMVRRREADAAGRRAPQKWQKRVWASRCGVPHLLQTCIWVAESSMAVGTP